MINYIIRSLFFLLFVFFSTLKNSYCQTITYEDFKEVIPFLEKEEYKEAYKLTKKLLKNTVNDSSDLRGIVTYMNLFSASGMVIKDQMKHVEFEKISKEFIGQYVVMSAHPCIDSAANGFNSIQFRSKGNDTYEGTTIATNHKAINILFFEYFDYKENPHPSELIGKNVRCGGILSSGEINQNKSKIWIARIRIKDAFARVSEPR
ncbi:MAG: hypothetical protein ACRCVT_10200 [Leadbetterella sp.]